MAILFANCPFKVEVRVEPWFRKGDACSVLMAGIDQWRVGKVLSTSFYGDVDLKLDCGQRVTYHQYWLTKITRVSR